MQFTLRMKPMHQVGCKCLFFISLSLYFSSAFASSISSTVSSITSFEFTPCQVKHEAVALDAECATLQRPENPTKPDGKQIEIFAARLAATTANPAEDAFTLIQGGPGGSSIDLGIQLRQFLDMVRRHRDVILLDQRGTGRSNLLHCDAPEDTPNEFNGELVAKLTQQCIEKLRSDADLRYYTTSVAVQDLEALRIAAGYPQLSIYGASYGTRVAQHYLRRFPEQSRLVILDGVVDIELNLAGPEIALRSQDAFDLLAERCAATTECKAQFGDIKTKFQQLQTRLSSEPITVTHGDPTTGKSGEITLGEADLLTAVRLMPYATESSALLPLMIAQAHDGNYRLLAAQSKLIQQSIGDSLAVGMHNSVACTEDEAFFDYSQAASAAQTYFGDQAQESMRISCSSWPRGLIDDDFRQPFDSQQPVLILSGETDPITPPANGDRAHQMLSNSKHLVVPGHGHGVVMRGCVPFLVNEFLESTLLGELNTQCIERERATPFFVSASGPKP